MQPVTSSTTTQITHQDAFLTCCNIQRPTKNQQWLLPTSERQKNPWLALSIPEKTQTVTQQFTLPKSKNHKRMELTKSNISASSPPPPHLPHSHKLNSWQLAVVVSQWFAHVFQFKDMKYTKLICQCDCHWYYHNKNCVFCQVTLTEFSMLLLCVDRKPVVHELRPLIYLCSLTSSIHYADITRIIKFVTGTCLEGIFPKWRQGWFQCWSFLLPKLWITWHYFAKDTIKINHRHQNTKV